MVIRKDNRGNRRYWKMKKLFVCMAFTISGTALLSGCGQERLKAGNFQEKTVQVGVAVYNEKDAFVSDICEYLDQEIYEYENRNPDVKILREIADAGGSQQEQNEQIKRFVDLDYDLLLVNIVDRTNAAVIVDWASEAGIPVVFFNREPVKEDIFRGEEIYYEGSDAKQSALLQADIIADAYEDAPETIDKNGDGVIGFAMLEGESNHQDTIIRSEWVLRGIEERGIQVKKIVRATANWERNQANVIVKQWLEEYPEEIELIICNNDDMALGAWEALEEMQCTEIRVVGIDGVEQVQKLVKEGKILGTVLCDTQLHAKALLTFIEAFAIDGTKEEGIALENERYYRIPLRIVAE